MSAKQTFLNIIDNYKDTIYAIIGFMNFYRYDDSTHSDRKDIFVFQGRKLFRKDNADKEGDDKKYITPDIGICLPENTGIIGEVKNSFPMDKSLWEKELEQIVSYDKEFVGWPCKSGEVSNHDIVLLVHYSRAVAIRDYYREGKDDKFKISRPFCLIEYQRVNQSKSFVAFRIQEGTLSNLDIHNKLYGSNMVPMDVFIEKYSTVKIIDSEPPLPYLLQLIFENVILQKAIEHPKFKQIHKRQKIEIRTSIDEIVETLSQGFSFRALEANFTNEHRTPRREWVLRACEKLVSKSEAKWISADEKNELLAVYQKLEPVLDHYIQLCSDEEPATGIKQMNLFEQS
jgi:hypothetical protein